MGRLSDLSLGRGGGNRTPDKGFGDPCDTTSPHPRTARSIPEKYPVVSLVVNQENQRLTLVFTLELSNVELLTIDGLWYLRFDVFSHRAAVIAELLKHQLLRRVHGVALGVVVTAGNAVFVLFGLTDERHERTKPFFSHINPFNH